MVHISLAVHISSSDLRSPHPSRTLSPMPLPPTLFVQHRDYHRPWGIHYKYSKGRYSKATKTQRDTMVKANNQMGRTPFPPSYNKACNNSGSDKTTHGSRSSKSLFGFLKFKKQAPNPNKELASKTPQWRWTNTQCRDWIKAVCIWYLGYDEEDAQKVSSKFKGFGDTLYGNTHRVWKHYFKDQPSDAHAICSLIYNLQKAKRPLPRTHGGYSPWKEDTK